MLKYTRQVIGLKITNFDLWKFLQQTDRPIIIYGMGNGADKIIKELTRLGITPYGIMASDDFVRGQSFHGFTVKKLSDFRNTDNMIILTSFGSQRPEVIQTIIDISLKYTLFSPDVPVYGGSVFNREFYENNQRKLESVYELLADDQSKQTLENVINFKLSGNINYLIHVFSEKDEVFQQILRFDEKESFLDLGAYRGDTIQEFLSYTNGKYRHITALEPDRKTFAKLKQYAGTMHNTQLFNMGIWDNDCDLAFDASLGRGSSVKSGGSQPLAVTKIDTLYRRRTLTYLKADVEGAERRALLGGALTLKRDKPKINLAVYHRSEDLFELPLLLHEINPEYRLYLRQHPHIPAWDLNLYAV